MVIRLLWFDVGNGRYTTDELYILYWNGLWFDVGNGRYTTAFGTPYRDIRCGLM